MSAPLVLLYHIVLPPPSNATGVERKLFLHPERFDDHLRDLRRRGFRSLTLDEYATGLNHGFSPKSVVITFDDAYAHVGDVATPVLRRYGFNAVIFAPLSHLGQRNNWDSLTSPNLAKLGIATVRQLCALDPEVWEVASHGFRHVDLRSVARCDRRMELIRARECLSSLLGRPVLDLAYPYGGHDKRVRRDVELAGYRMAFATGAGYAWSRFQLPRWPISGEDSLKIFRLKTSAWSYPVYWAYGATPTWVRQPTATLVRRAASQGL